MNSVIKEPCGCVLDHSSFQIIISDSKANPNRSLCYRLKKELFEVYSPFYMDSQIQRLKEESLKNNRLVKNESLQTISEETSAQRKRKKRKAFEYSTEERKVSELLERSIPTLVEKAKEQKHLRDGSEYSILLSDNNKDYRNSASILGFGDVFREACKQEGTKIRHCKQIVLNEESQIGKYDPLSLVNTLVANPMDTGTILYIDKHQFLIPPASRFLMSSFSNLVAGLDENLVVAGGYDCIVLDPPWTNKSVKRKKSYLTFDESELCSLPMSMLSKPGGLVCVWVTNNDRIISFLKDVLFPVWKVELIAEWIWVKVTQFGELVCDIQSSHKKPYERLIIGRKIDDDDVNCTMDGALSSSTHEKYEPFCTSCRNHGNTKTNSKLNQKKRFKSDNENKAEISDKETECCRSMFAESIKAKGGLVPNDYIIMSIPCSLHSKKPPLAEMITQYLPTNPKCLEMFARNLLPGWTSWGNEVLRHQHRDYFDAVT